MLDRDAEFLRARVRPVIPTRANFWIKERTAKGEVSITGTRNNFPGYRRPIENRRVIASEAAAATLIRE